MGKIVNEDIIRVVSLGTVDNDSLKILVPTLRLAEKLTKFPFTLDRIGSESFDERIGNVIVNIVGISMTKIIFKSSPDVLGELFFEFVHSEDLHKN